MKIKLIKILSVLCALFVLLSMSVSQTFAVSFPNKVATKSESILLVNMDTGQTVFEKEADTKRYPASTTKIMTYIVAVENISDLNNTRIEITEEILEKIQERGSYAQGISSTVGKKMTVIDLLHCLMVPTGNDAAILLADYICDGDIDKFVQMMNEKAKELGCENTHFTNPEGTHDPDHYTTARDLYKMATYALTLPKFAEITNSSDYYCEGDDYPLVTTNYIIDEWRGGDYYYMYAKGIKAGTTDEAGRCLVTTAAADGYSYMAVLLKAPYKEETYETNDTFYDAADLFRWSLTELELKMVASQQTPICEQKVELAWNKDSVHLVPEKNINVILPENYEEKWVTIEKNVPESIDAPIKKGTPVGTVTVYYQDDKMHEKQELVTVNLVPDENVEQSGFLFVLRVITTILQSFWFIGIITIIALILAGYFIMGKINRKNNKTRKKVKNYRNL
ncbi:MAG: D-alanyl-D-alanine carboxypeptidase family protein [Ruminococcus sp.]|nr:D-alanyl-D-alanine carboxypeptidase family protein [Ruminococcus sp.]